MPETAEQYRKRMLDQLGGKDPLKLQAAAPGKIEKLLKGVPAGKLRKRPAPGKWSVAEIIAHVADTELVGGFRMRLILGSPGTPVVPFDQVTAPLLEFQNGDWMRNAELVSSWTPL